MKESHTLLIGCILALLVSGKAGAHGDENAPLYVAETGTDKGDCQEVARPCRTIGYAIARLGKGGEIRVAEGSYAVSDPDAVFHLANGSVPISGGYISDSNFLQRGETASTLHGVPIQYAEDLSRRGFHVIADNKGIGSPVLEQTIKNVAVHQALKSSITATPCSAGSAAGLPCLSVDLLSHVGSAAISAQPGDAADVWGFVDLNTSREYALVGFDIGTAVFDVTDAENPREVGFVEGRRSAWRDIKVYQLRDEARDRWRAYAYVSTDGTTDGLFVIDLGGLPHSISRVPYPSDFSAAHNIYLTGTDYGTGLLSGPSTPRLVVAGSNIESGPYRSYGLSSAAAPGFETMPGVGRNDYSHDVAAAVISDNRKDTQCVDPAAAWCELLFDFNEFTFDIWDITDGSAPVRLSRSNYPNVAYVHSGWIAEDGRYLFVHDELDERDFGLATTLRIYDLANLSAPLLAGTWTGPTTAIDHNGFVRGNRYYMSNYSRGLTVLDITEPAGPVVAGHFDTFPGSDGIGFVGAWGTYPYFHSGNIAISDIDSGFYMVADRSLDVAEGRLAFAAAAFGGIEGGSTTLAVERLGGASGNVSAGYEILPATGDAADVGVSRGVIEWGDGDSSTKTITVDLVADGTAEAVEQLLVRLVAPKGGATVGADRVASLYISEPGEQSFVGFDLESVEIAETGFATAVAVVRRSGSAVGRASVDFALGSGNADAGIDFSGATSGTLNWEDGDGDPRWIEYSIIDDGQQEATETFEIVLSNPTGAELAAKSVMRVSITGTGGNEPPPPGPSKGNGSGGAADWLLLSLLLAAAVAGRRPTRRDAA